MTTIYYENDADIAQLNGKKIAVIGYGSQGHAHALNMKDSGQDVRIGLHEGSRSKAKAEAEGLRVVSVAEAAREADIIMVVIPDPIQGKVYEEQIQPNPRAGQHADVRAWLQCALRLYCCSGECGCVDGSA